MYFCRYNEQILTNAYVNEIITETERQQIYEFWENNVMYNLSLEHATYLQEQGFKLMQEEDDQYKIIEWPFLKIMHLLVCKRNPRIWICQDDNGDFLFGYTIQPDFNEFSLEASKF